MTTSFAELGLNEQIMSGVDALGFTTPTPVQAQAIPVALQGRDVVASAQTGTGKTAAFTLPTLQLIGRITDQWEAERRAAQANRETAAAADANGHEAPAGSGVTEAGAFEQNAPVDSQVSVSSASTESDTPASAETPRGAASSGAETAEPGQAADATDVPAPAKKRRRRRRKGNSSDAGGAAADAPFTPSDLGPHALVITPTRELATQIDQVASTVAQATGQSVVTVIGGERYDRQLKHLSRGCDMLVATPGRLIDLLERKAADLSHVQVLVLDEADRMLDMGFWPSVRRIIAQLPKERQTLLFSATISGDIERSMPTMLHDPVNVEIARVGQTAETVEQRLVPVVQGQKVQLLSYLIAQDKPSRVLVFCRTKQRADSVAAALERTGLHVGVMHADRRQRDRERALADFRAGKLEALVATDVMSRGIDVDGIDWVVNFDVPMDTEDYVHRIGRTGRAGQSGIAFTFMAPDEVSPLREIEYFTKQLVPVWEPEGFEFAQGRIVPNPKRACTRSARSMFSGSRSSRGRGPAGGRFGRHT